MKYSGTVGYTTDTVFDEHGTEHTFITVTSVGITRTGKALPRGHMNKEDAWKAFDEELEKFRRDSKYGYFHWRKVPDLKYTELGTYYVISRVISTNKRLYESRDDLPFPTEGSKTPITDQVIGDYIDLPIGAIGSTICDVRYDMEQLELKARRYDFIVKNQFKLAKLLQYAGEELSQKQLDDVIDTAIRSPSIPMENVLRTYRYLDATRGDFMERLAKARDALPDDIPSIMCGPLK